MSIHESNGESFLCECYDLDCRNYLPLDTDGYLAAHKAAGANGAVVLPGHIHPSDRILSDAGSYVIVRGAE